jgi:hypothetical protein
MPAYDRPVTMPCEFIHAAPGESVLSPERPEECRDSLKSQAGTDIRRSGEILVRAMFGPGRSAVRRGRVTG